MSDWLGWAFTSLLLGVLVFMTYAHRPPRTPPATPPTPEVKVTLAINGLNWNATAKWAYLRDREQAKLALVRLAEEIDKQGQA